MPIQLPELADKTYKDIMDEMLVSIPKYSDTWTNYNPSDPGITILELLSWIAEITLYRINRIPEESYVNFLRLVAGASGSEVKDFLSLLENDPNADRARIKLLKFLKDVDAGEKKSTDEIKAVALDYLNSHYRAVTKDDFEAVSIEATENEADAKVKRAIVFEHPDEGRIEIIIVTDLIHKDSSVYENLIKKVSDYLYPRRLVGTIIEVKAPVYTDVMIDIKIVCYPYAKPDVVLEKIRKEITEYLDPLVGGTEKNGWPYGRALTVFEIDRIIEETEGVEHAKSVVFDKNEKLITKEIKGLVYLKSLTVEE